MKSFSETIKKYTDMIDFEDFSIFTVDTKKEVNERKKFICQLQNKKCKTTMIYTIYSEEKPTKKEIIETAISSIIPIIEILREGCESLFNDKFHFKIEIGDVIDDWNYFVEEKKRFRKVFGEEIVVAISNDLERR